MQRCVDKKQLNKVKERLGKGPVRLDDEGVLLELVAPTAGWGGLGERRSKFRRKARLNVSVIKGGKFGGGGSVIRNEQESVSVFTNDLQYVEIWSVVVEQNFFMF